MLETCSYRCKHSQPVFSVQHISPCSIICCYEYKTDAWWSLIMYSCHVLSVQLRTADEIWWQRTNAKYMLYPIIAQATSVVSSSRQVITIQVVRVHLMKIQRIGMSQISKSCLSDYKWRLKTYISRVETNHVRWQRDSTGWLWTQSLSSQNAER